MRTSRDGLMFIKSLSKYRSTPWKDEDGKLKIGYDHPVRKGEVFGAVSNIESTNLLKEDLKEYENLVNNVVKVTLNQNQFDALVSYSYKVGKDGFQNSKLLRDINDDVKNITLYPHFLQWLCFDKKSSLGQYSRRALEADLFNKEVA